MLGCAQRGSGGSDGFFRQRQDLKEVAIKGNEVLFNQAIAGHYVVIEREAKQGTQFIVAVVRQTVAVCHQNEQDIEQAFVLAQAVPETMP